MSVLIVPHFAFAQEPAQAPTAEGVDDLASAKELFRKGLVHFEARDYGRALPFFESSRALVASYQNTLNVALCLDGLGRNADALRAYEHFVSMYGNGIDAQTRAMAETRIVELRQETFVAVPISASPPSAPTITPVVATPALPVKKVSGRLTAGVFLGYAGGPSLGSDAEAQAALTCDADCPLANGLVVGGRVGYRIGSMISLEVSGGYLRLGSAFEREVATTYGAANELDVNYRLDQRLVVSGPFAGLGVSVRYPFAQRFSLVGRVGIAGVAADVTNTMSGTVQGADDPAELSIKQERTAVSMASVLVTPEVTMEAALGGVVFGAGLGMWVSTLPGPTFGERRLLPSNVSLCAQSAESATACTPESRVTSGEGSIGAFVVFVPQISARYQFD